MKRITVDGFELGDPGASLELALAAPVQHQEFSAFLSASGASTLLAAPVPNSWDGWCQIVQHLRAFAGVDVPHPSKFRTTALLLDDWYCCEVAFAFESHMVWYRWQTAS